MPGQPPATGGMPDDAVTVLIHPLVGGLADDVDDAGSPTASQAPQPHSAAGTRPAGSPTAAANGTASAAVTAGAANGAKVRRSSDDDSGQDTDSGDQAAAAAGTAAAAGPAPVATAKLGRGPSSKSSSGQSQGAATPKGIRKRRVVHLQLVVQDTYEYHGMNDLALFLLFAAVTSLVLFFHWPSTTAIFKNSVQNAFQQYGNPDWQNQKLMAQDNMFDGLEYITGFLQFHYQRTQAQNFAQQSTIRIGEYAEIKYARLLVNLENNCNKDLGHLECYSDPGQDPYAARSGVSMLEALHGWDRIDSMNFRQSTHAGTPWLAYTLVAPRLNGQPITSTLALERLFNITTQTTIAEENASDPHPDIKPYIARYAYSITLDMLAVNVMGKESPPDMAVFSMQVQRSDVPARTPDRAFWQITTTVPARTGFYNLGSTDYARAVLEVLLLGALAIVTYAQVWQMRVARAQHKSPKPFWTQTWNIVEAGSTFALFVWIAYYIALTIALAVMHKNWNIDAWDEGYTAQVQLNQMEAFANWYSGWLYGAILVNAIVVMRLVRYMRIHAGLKAFYQVFIIAAREFADFAVFLVYILLLLGLSVFAFFQLTGGNWQFLRFSDGISVMTRLTFGFLDYKEFQNDAMGLGTAVAAVTFLFWVAVLLLIVYTQNIILAIVAEAYERAKADIGSARTSFLTLVFQRLVFVVVLCAYGVRLMWRAARERRLRLHEEEMYRDIVSNAKTMRSKTWRGVALRRWAAWALCRTQMVKSMSNLYQDYASFKLKAMSPWTQADDILRSHMALAGNAAPSAAAKDPSLDFVTLPELGEGVGYVDADQLEALFRTAADMRYIALVTPSPFTTVDETTIKNLVAGIMVVYGFDVEEDEAYALTRASAQGGNGGSGPGSSSGGGGSSSGALNRSSGPWGLQRTQSDLATGAKDGQRRGGFLKRLNSIRNGGTHDGGGSPRANLPRSRTALREVHRQHQESARANKQQRVLMDEVRFQLRAQRQAAAETSAQVQALMQALGVGANTALGSFAQGPGSVSGGSLALPMLGGLSFAARTSQNRPVTAPVAGAAAAAATANRRRMASLRPGLMTVNPYNPLDSPAAAPASDVSEVAAQLAAQQAMLQQIMGLLQQQQQDAQGAPLSPQEALGRQSTGYPDVPHIT